MATLVNINQAWINWFTNLSIKAAKNTYDLNACDLTYTASKDEYILACCSSTWGQNATTSNRYTANMTITTTGKNLKTLNNGYLMVTEGDQNKYPYFRADVIQLKAGQTVTLQTTSTQNGYVTNQCYILGV